MSDTATAFNWRLAIEQTFNEFYGQMVAHVPELIGATALLLVGWLVAQALRLGTRRLVRGLDRLLLRGARDDSEQRERIQQSYELIAGQVVFWAILIFFLAASANLLGWNLLTGWMSSLIAFLPSLLSGLLIILAGYLIGNMVYSAVLGAAAGAGLSQGTVLARISQVVVLFSSIVIGIEQIGLNVDFLTSIIVVIIGVLLAGAALAFGIGARELAANVIGAQQLRKHCRIGDRVRIGNFAGELLEITQTSAIVDAPEGRAVVPARLFHEQVTLLNPRAEDSAAGEEDHD